MLLDVHNFVTHDGKATPRLITTAWNTPGAGAPGAGLFAQHPRVLALQHVARSDSFPGRSLGITSLGDPDRTTCPCLSAVVRSACSS
jgi:hypothetical protein